MTDPKMQAFEDALGLYRVAVQAGDPTDSYRRLLRLYEEAVKDAERWEEYALHAAGCVECGETSWENCFEGKTLRDAAMGAANSGEPTDG